MRAQRSPTVLDEWAQSMTAVMEVAWLAAAVIGGAGALVLMLCLNADHLADASGSRRHRRWWAQRRAVRSFATAACGGDLDTAERAAGRILRSNDAGARAGCAWDESVVLPCTWSSATASLCGVEAIARRFPVSRRVDGHGATDVFVGRHGQVQLRMLGEWVVPGDGAHFIADAGGTLVTGHLVLQRPTIASISGAGVEVRVHVEVTPGRGSQRVLRATRSVIRTGLRRWAAEVPGT